MSSNPLFYETVVIFGFSFVIPLYVKLMAAATLIGLTVGLERALRKKVASLRTFGLICTGSCLFSIISAEAGRGALTMTNPQYDVTRVAAGIVTGIGFIGGGVIFKSADRVEGITTAAMIWMTTALGMACGFNDLPLAFCGLFFYLLILLVSHFMHRIIGTNSPGGKSFS